MHRLRTLPTTTQIPSRVPTKTEEITGGSLLGEDAFEHQTLQGTHAMFIDLLGLMPKALLIHCHILQPARGWLFDLVVEI